MTGRSGVRVERWRGGLERGRGRVASAEHVLHVTARVAEQAATDNSIL